MKKSTLLLKVVMLGGLFICTSKANAQLDSVSYTKTNLPSVGRGEARIADFDKDGNLDIVIVGQNSAYNSTSGGIVGIYKGDGTGGFTDMSSTWLPSATTVACGTLSVCDYDNDGYPDICYAGITGTTLYVALYHNDIASANKFSDSTSYAFASTTAPTGIYSGSIDWADIDNDGDKDLLIVGRAYTVAVTYPGSSAKRTSTTELYKNNGNGTFTVATLAATSVCFGQAQFADFDSDGDPDIYFSGGGNVGGYFINDGTGGFGTAVSNVSTGDGLSTTRASNSVLADFTGDSKVDILESYINSNNSYTLNLRLATNTISSSTWTFTPTYPSFVYGIGGTGAGDTSNMASLAAADYDSDGDLDFVIQGYNTSGIKTTSLALNNGSGTFTDAGLSLTGLHFGDDIWGDVNNDGKPDLLTFGYTGPCTSAACATRLYLNNYGTSTSVAEKSADKLKVFPNPTTSTLKLDNASDITKYEIVNVNGAKVIEGTNSNSQLEIDVTSLSSGIYVLKTYSKTSVNQSTFVKE
jgi:hypothetical protein